MKRIFVGVTAALFSSALFATTLSPIQLLNPSGSTSGQVIASTGPTTAPAWTTVTLSGLGGLAAANNLSDVASASTSRTNLGLGTAALVNTGTSGATIPLLSAANTWMLAQSFTVRPTFNGNTPYDTGNLTIGSYLTAATAASTYATIAQATTALAATGGSINGVTNGLTTPAASKVTTLQATSTITPSTTSGIVGTTLGDSAQAGSVGEYQTVTGSAVGIATGTTAAATSLSLTAGDWDVQGVVLFTSSAAGAMTGEYSAVSTSATSLGSTGSYAQAGPPTSAGTVLVIPSPIVRINVSSTTTVYATANVGFGSGTCTVTGFLRARRVR